MAAELLQIKRAVYGGTSLAHRENGAVVFVPFTLPHELVEAATQDAVVNASLINIVEPSPDRVPPHCPHFGPCGGCQYQHASYQAQLAMKRDILLETMQRAGVENLPELQTKAAEPWEYRNRVRFRVESRQGEVRFGYSARGTNDFLGIHECPIAAPLLVRAAEVVIGNAVARGLLELPPSWNFLRTRSCPG